MDHTIDSKALKPSLAAARQGREHGLLGAVFRTNASQEDPVWHEYPERLKRVNDVFAGRCV
jgi:hypothetical protein